MMRRSHCICPKFLSKNIGDDSVFLNFFMGTLLKSEDQIVLDREEQLSTSYVLSLSEDVNGFTNYKMWRRLLDTCGSGKTLLSSSAGSSSSGEVVYRTISRAITSFCKSIVADDNNHYADFIAEINRQRISLLNLQNVNKTLAEGRFKPMPTYTELEADIEWVLQRLARRSKKSDSEDYSNDYLRDMIMSKGYEVKDQTREGQSSSGLSAGELDIIIEHQMDLFAIIEAMRLESVDSNYINAHYTKLLSNYNPVDVKRTFLITYYSGSSFDAWWARYCAQISTLNMAEISGKSGISAASIDLIETPYGSIKKLHHHLNAGDEHSLCIHMAVKVGGS